MNITKPDILDVVSRYVDLRQHGKDYKGLCPFHQEKNPSFKVSLSKQSFYCFGCGASGDSIAFIQQIHGLSFRDALRYLGIKPGKPIAVDHTLELRKRLLKDFEEWRRATYQRLCRMRLVYEALTRDCQTMREAELVAPLLHELPDIEYKLNILFGNDKELQHTLYREEYENGRKEGI